MVGVRIGKIFILLLGLSLLLDRGDSALSKESLVKIMKDMYSRFRREDLKKEIENINRGRTEKMAVGNQYSIALQLLKPDCEKGHLGSNIPEDFTEIRNTLASERVYNKQYVVAAIPRHKYQGNIRTTDHAEYRVLRELVVRSDSGCLVVYSHFSPCFAKCLDNSHHQNILQLLTRLKDENRSTDVAFVFSSLFYYDRDNNTKDVIYKMLRAIESVPVYCCYRENATVVCAVFDRNKGKEQHCLSEKMESKEKTQ